MIENFIEIASINKKLNVDKLVAKAKHSSFDIGKLNTSTLCHISFSTAFGLLLLLYDR